VQLEENAAGREGGGHCGGCYRGIIVGDVEGGGELKLSRDGKLYGGRFVPHLKQKWITPHSYYLFWFLFNMSSLECAKSVANITSLLYQVQLIIQGAIEKQKIETPVDSHSTGAQLQALQHSAKEGIRRINMEYNQALRKIGSSFSDGDGMMISFQQNSSTESLRHDNLRR
jgi:hypothetical protein